MSAWEATGKSDDWHTPAYVFDALGVRFDLDVAAPERGPRHAPAGEWLFHGALDEPWHGFVWMNPPFGARNGIVPWLDRFFEHGNGVALTPDRTSAPWFQGTLARCDGVLFVSPKIRFEREDGLIGKSPGCGTALFASGFQGQVALANAASNGLGALAAPFRQRKVAA